MALQEPPTLLIVDDAVENLTVLNALLAPCYRVRVATTGEKALSIARSAPRPDLILLDVMMPVMDGYEVFARLRADPATCDIPVIFVTAMDSSEAELRGLELGAQDYLTKPLVQPIVLARVRNQLELKQARDLMANQNAWLEAEVARRLEENDITQEMGILALAHLAETRDSETGNHILRTQKYVKELAGGLREHPRFAATLDDRYITLLHRSAALHDIGKVGIPDQILRKPGPLSADEWTVMKTHSALGARAIEMAEREVSRPIAFLGLAKEIAHWHHEKWDGSGYPDGLAGEQIPISARLMAVADVFDALVTPRVYKPAFSFAETRNIIAEGRGKHFDPDVTDAFMQIFDVLADIARRHADP
ncbi:MAG: response regulator [Azoarcus sp.]|jgi:putative two-component system response regulator|nr:response regulator [Azoarcus sp.]MDX9839291.1 response regulator [Azoarcus sp.]